MTRLARSVVRLHRLPAERGATAAEYALMVGLIAVVIVVSVTIFGVNTSALFNIPAGVLDGLP